MPSQHQAGEGDAVVPIGIDPQFLSALDGEAAFIQLLGRCGADPAASAGAVTADPSDVEAAIREAATHPSELFAFRHLHQLLATDAGALRIAARSPTLRRLYLEREHACAEARATFALGVLHESRGGFDPDGLIVANILYDPVVTDRVRRHTAAWRDVVAGCTAPEAIRRNGLATGDTIDGDLAAVMRREAALLALRGDESATAPQQVIRQEIRNEAAATSLCRDAAAWETEQGRPAQQAIEKHGVGSPSAQRRIRLHGALCDLNRRKRKDRNSPADIKAAIRKHGVTNKDDLIRLHALAQASRPVMSPATVERLVPVTIMAERVRSGRGG